MGFGDTSCELGPAWETTKLSSLGTYQCPSSDPDCNSDLPRIVELVISYCDIKIVLGLSAWT